MSSVGPLITCRFCNSFSALTHAEVNAHRIREQCDVAFLARFESGSDSAPSPNGSVQDDQMSLGGVSISSNQIGSIESHQDMDIDKNSDNSTSEGMITVIYMRIKNDINKLTTLDNDDEEEDNGYGPIMYEHVTSDEQTLWREDWCLTTDICVFATDFENLTNHIRYVFRLQNRERKRDVEKM